MDLSSSECLAERGDLAFKLVGVRQLCKALGDELGRMFEEWPAEDDEAIGADVALRIGWSLGAIERDIAFLARALDRHCPDLEPPPSERLAASSLDFGATDLRPMLEHAATWVEHVDDVVEQVTNCLVEEIGERISTSSGPDDQLISDWLSSPGPQS